MVTEKSPTTSDGPTDITLSSLSGDELLNILKQSLGKNLSESKETQESLAHLLSHSLSQSKSLASSDKNTMQVQHSIELSTPPPSGANSVNLTASHVSPQVSPDDEADSAARNLLQDLLEEKPIDLDPPLQKENQKEESDFLLVSSLSKDVLESSSSMIKNEKQEKQEKEPMDPNFPFSLGKLASSLSISETLSSFKSSLTKKLTSMKGEVEKKKESVQSIRDKTVIAKEQYEKAIKHLEMALLAFKDAESEIKSLESMCEWISSFEQSSQQSIQDLISCIASPLPSEWKSMVGPHVCLVLNDGKSCRDQDADDGLELKMIDFEDSGPSKSSKPSTSTTSSTSSSSLKNNNNNSGAIEKRKRSPDVKEISSSNNNMDDICLAYNRNDCYSSSCRRVHNCLNCGSYHPVVKCGSDKSYFFLYLLNLHFNRTERIMCVQFNVDHTKCVGSEKCIREHRCLRCCSKRHSINDCPILGPSKASSRYFLSFLKAF